MTFQDGCRDFRAKLARALEGLPMPEELTTLAWHEHLLGCGSCRDLLQREEALEVLLATLPEPKLPPDLTRRLVARLSKAEEAGLDNLLEYDGVPIPEGLSHRVRAGVRSELDLDRLLDLDAVVDVPAGLADRVRAGVRSESGLEALLDLAGPVEVPAGLSADVLSGLAVHRERKVGRLRLLRSVPVYAAAAGLLLTALGVSLWNAGLDSGAPDDSIVMTEEVASVDSSEPDPSLLAVLDIIENDGLWRDTEDGAEVAPEEADLHLLLSDSLEMSDELLLTFLDEEEIETEIPSGG